ncbi:MAG TPA: histone deacetylase, partial [bacterium]|nr:histone deacetylase [bacterium]
IVDWDVHHGNGTMHSFEDSDQVLFISTHQYPYYPGTGRRDDVGKGRGRGFSVNIPLPGGQGDDDFVAIFQRVVVPVVRLFSPKLILVSAGFDIARGDPLGGMDVTPKGFGALTRILMALAAECCPGRLAFILEGGYNLGALAGGVAAVLATLAAGNAAPPGSAEPGPEAAAVIGAVLREHAPYWRLPS